MSSPPVDLANLRRTYRMRGLSEAELAADPATQFQAWLHDAVAAGLPEPNAMAVATADARGRPSVRHVLLKGHDARGFTFFTNLRSRKGRQLDENPWASLTFPWFPIERQVLVDGGVERVSRAETEAYWRSRPRESQLGALASPQSCVVPDRATLDARLAELDAAHPGGVPLPEDWGGFRVVPETVEFWQGRIGRLHDRLRYRRARDAADAADVWTVERLAP